MLRILMSLAVIQFNQSCSPRWKVNWRNAWSLPPPTCEKSTQSLRLKTITSRATSTNTTSTFASWGSRTSATRSFASIRKENCRKDRSDSLGRPKWNCSLRHSTAVQAVRGRRQAIRRCVGPTWWAMPRQLQQSTPKTTLPSNFEM